MGKLKYSCLVLDHDDTVVNSTPTIHYPSYRRTLEMMRPGVTPLPLEDFYSYCFDPGIISLFRDIYHFTNEEMEVEVANWNEFVSTRVSRPFEGMREIMEKQKVDGGLICVVSHSLSHNIRRDYQTNQLPEPDLVIGFESKPEENKPNPFPLQKIMAQYQLSARELLVVDDLLPGFEMAQGCGVDFAYAGWAFHDAKIQAFMREHSTWYCTSVAALSQLLFS